MSSSHTEGEKKAQKRSDKKATAAAASNQVNICWSNRIIHIHTQSTEIHQRPACCAPDRTSYLFNVCLNLFFSLALFFALSPFVCVFGRVGFTLRLAKVCWRGRATTSQVACAMMNQKEKYCQIGDINHPCKGASATGARARQPMWYKRIFLPFYFEQIVKMRFR